MLKHSGYDGSEGLGPPPRKIVNVAARGPALALSSHQWQHQITPGYHSAIRSSAAADNSSLTEHKLIEVLGREDTAQIFMSVSSSASDSSTRRPLSKTCPLPADTDREVYW